MHFGSAVFFLLHQEGKDKRQNAEPGNHVENITPLPLLRKHTHQGGGHNHAQCAPAHHQTLHQASILRGRCVDGHAVGGGVIGGHAQRDQNQQGQEHAELGTGVEGWEQEKRQGLQRQPQNDVWLAMSHLEETNPVAEQTDEDFENEGSQRNSSDNANQGK